MQTERILRVKDVTTRVGLSRSSVYAKAKDEAIREAHRNYDEEEYFHARQQIDCNDRRRVFQDGFVETREACIEDAVESGCITRQEIEEGLAKFERTNVLGKGLYFSEEESQ